MDAAQRYAFDAAGFLVVPDVITPAQVATLLAGCREWLRGEPRGNDQASGLWLLLQG
jgi:hypothetical protein